MDMASLVSKRAFIASLAYFFYSKEGIKNKSLNGHGVFSKQASIYCELSVFFYSKEGIKNKSLNCNI